MWTWTHERRTDRFAIVGTAGTWRDVPWDDQGLTIATLNDAYNLGFPRIDMQFEQHPLDSFVFHKPGTRTTPEVLPPGRYLRPVGYLDWLERQSQSIPVMLHSAPPDGWVRAQRYPREYISETFREILRIDPTWPKDYVRSGPAWMILYALDHGYPQIEIYGIHLATDREYRDQRPNFELLIGYAIGKGVTVKIAQGAPICKGEQVYNYEPRPAQAEDILRYRMSVVERDLGKAKRAEAQAGRFTRERMKSAVIALEAKRRDLQEQLNRVSFASHMQRPEWQVGLRTG